MQGKKTGRGRWLDWLMGLLGVLVLTGVIVLELYAPAKYRGFFIKECQQITSTFDVSWGNQDVKMTLPGMIENPDRDPIRLQMVLNQEELGDGDSILFRSRQSGAKIYLDEELVYDSGAAYNYPFLLGYGSFWRSIKLGENYNGKTLTVELTPAYGMQAVSGYLPEFYFGTQAAFLTKILKSMLGYLLLTLLLIAFGISMVIYGLALIRKEETHPLLILGLFSADTGVWMLTESHVLELFAGNIPVIIYLGYVSYGLMPVLLVRYLLGYKEFKTKRYLRMLYLSGMVLNIVQLLLTMSGICSEFELQWLNRIYLGLTAAGFLLALSSARKVEKERRRLYSGILILVISAICELGYFLLVNKKNSGRILLFGICLFVVKSGIDLFREIGQIQKKAIEQEVLIKMAYKDALTRLGNRYAYEYEKSSLEEKGTMHVTVLVVGMEGLKQANERYGHTYGDQIICRAAEILVDAFRDVGKCFRTGGDEFCVLAEHAERGQFEMGLRQMETAMAALKDKIEGYGIAYGVAEGAAMEIEDLFHIADNLMYSRKRDIKKAEDERVKN